MKVSIDMNIEQFRDFGNNISALPTAFYDNMHGADKAFFPVASERIHDKIGPTKFQRIHHEHTDETVAVVGKDYPLVPYQTKFQSMIDAVLDSGLDVEDMEAKVQTSHKGGRFFGGLKLPNECVEVGNSDDKVALSFVMWDSYNRSSSTKINAGYFQYLCANEAYIGTKIANVNKPHRGAWGDAEVTEIFDGVLHAVEDWKRAKVDFARWSGNAVSERSVSAALTHFDDRNDNQDRIFRLFREESGFSSEGTLWHLVNALTSWATHTPGRNTVNKAANRADRHVKVMEFRNSEQFRNLETVN